MAIYLRGAKTLFALDNDGMRLGKVSAELHNIAIRPHHLSPLRHVHRATTIVAPTAVLGFGWEGVSWRGPTVGTWSADRCLALFAVLWRTRDGEVHL